MQLLDDAEGLLSDGQAPAALAKLFDLRKSIDDVLQLISSTSVSVWDLRPCKCLELRIFQK